MQLRGLVVPTPTLFDAVGELDPARNRTYAEGLSRAGVEHLFPLGSLGEFPSIEEPERDHLLRALADGLRSPTDLWVGVGAPSTRRAVRNARAAADLGATAVVAVPPYYLTPTEPAIAEYYREIARSVGVPLLAYNIPAKVGYALRPGLVHELARDGVLVGIKDTAGSIESVRSFLRGAPPGFAVLPGDDLLARTALGEGAAGAVMGLANIVPGLGIGLVRAALSNDLNAAAKHEAVLGRLAAVVALGPFPSTGKYLAHLIRQAPTGYRAPYGPLTDAEIAVLLGALAPLRPSLDPYLREG